MSEAPAFDRKTLRQVARLKAAMEAEIARQDAAEKARDDGQAS